MFKDTKDLQKSLSDKLAPYAVKDTAGRFFEEHGDDTRLPFQLDRDRVIHCKSFRRLEEKTQVFTASYGDHYRTRLTHTMEVAQISRDIARSLGLNEDLAEAIALAHDLGHPPFGHAGEDTLNEIMRKYGSYFEHNEQSRKIVEKLEQIYPDHNGLNLTTEVLDGLIKHRTSWDSPRGKSSVSPHLEAQVVNLADEIAYTNHDIDDGLRSKVFAMEDLEPLGLWQEARLRVLKKYKDNLSGEVERSRLVSSLINLMIHDLYEQTGKNLKSLKIKTLENVRACKGPVVAFSPQMKKDVKELRDFLFEHFYSTEKVQSHLKKGRRIIQDLFEIYVSDITKIPERNRSADDKPEIIIRDYIAGMTDGFAKKEHKKLVKMKN
ncbi:MAG: deoxyguanosinetriphosphate triphosphohydrolase [Patescibacteria group bacterium]